MCDQFKCQFTEFHCRPNAPGRKKPLTNILQKALLLLKSVSQQVWCSNELIRKTPKKFRMCIDPRRPFSDQYTRCQLLMKNFIASVQPNASHLLMLRKASSIFLSVTSPHGGQQGTSYGKYQWLHLSYGITSAPVRSFK